MEQYQEALITETEENEMNGVENMADVVYVEATETGFWNEHGMKVAGAGAGLATLAAGFTGGFFTGKHTEAKKRKMFMSEIVRNMKLVEAEAAGKDTVEIDGVSYPTASHKVENVDDLLNVINENILKDKKVKETEKAEWIAIAIDLANAGARARATQIVTDNEIVGEEKEENKKK